MTASGRESKRRKLCNKNIKSVSAEFLLWLLAQRFVWFVYQRPNEKTGHVSWHCTFGGSRLVIHLLWRKRCALATDPDTPDRGSGERVGRGVFYQSLPLNHLSPRGVVVYTYIYAYIYIYIYIYRYNYSATFSVELSAA